MERCSKQIGIYIYENMLITKWILIGLSFKILHFSVCRQWRQLKKTLRTSSHVRSASTDSQTHGLSHVVMPSVWSASKVYTSQLPTTQTERWGIMSSDVPNVRLCLYYQGTQQTICPSSSTLVTCQILLRVWQRNTASVVFVMKVIRKSRDIALRV